jgi:hypothetical protein
MSRLTHVLTVFALTGALAGATVAACGARPGAPGEMPPTAPRPGPTDPSGAPTPSTPGGGLGPTVPAGLGRTIDDAGTPNPLSPGPVSVRTLPTPEFAATAYGMVSGQQTPPRDAGASDSYAPPLPPIPDGGVPVDSRLEPREVAERFTAQGQ